MKPKTIILMVVAVTCGLGASYMTSRLLAQRGEDTTEEKVEVVVAAEPIEMGVFVKNIEKQFTIKTYLRGQEPKDAVTKKDDLKGKLLKRPLRAGDWVSAGDLISDKDGGIAFLMSQNYRAVGIRINLEAGASGFATAPHSRVDIVSTIRRGDDRGSLAQLLLQNVLVLAVDTNDKRDAESRAQPGQVVVVMLKPEDLLKVRMAGELGSLTLVLRKPGDTTILDIDPFSADNLVNRTKSGKAEDKTGGDSAPPVAKGTELPALPKDVAAAKVVSDAAKGSVSKLRIWNGPDDERTLEFFYDVDGNPAPREVSRSEIRPEPAPVTPPRPDKKD